MWFWWVEYNADLKCRPFQDVILYSTSAQCFSSHVHHQLEACFLEAKEEVRTRAISRFFSALSIRVFLLYEID